ncbi:CRISPR-associated RAMP Cmr1 [Crocosphaera watsonii WH 0402]|uniref:CRISPR-associated RAMP Cmr1 n=1 Tax=Crocosphaera watsonii WH 0402 TaxID=1284629 RepID=T2JNK2_CROWT|nr:hypothetical protein [Crocosphaera watsonii]CCQ67458.1 CRISPR-associated RAMP Cmr1 [Crocosphaera watsonii WH 0402]
MNNVIFRPASPDDALEVAKLSILAAGGIFEFFIRRFCERYFFRKFVALEVKKEQETYLIFRQK